MSLRRLRESEQRVARYASYAARISKPKVEGERMTNEHIIGALNVEDAQRRATEALDEWKAELAEGREDTEDDRGWLEGMVLLVDFGAFVAPLMQRMSDAGLVSDEERTKAAELMLRCFAMAEGSDE